jgi:predicted DNA-binding transcriptional regulator YafY
MDLEIEVYETLLWIGSAIDPDWKNEEEMDPAEIDPTRGHSELVRWAIASGQDLGLSYFSRNRGELTERRITPISLEAETYIHAYCHLRRDERIFRISRIAELEPVGGWSRIKKELATAERARKKAEGAAEEEDDSQVTLF